MTWVCVSSTVWVLSMTLVDTQTLVYVVGWTYDMTQLALDRSLDIPPRRLTMVERTVLVSTSVSVAVSV